MKRVSKYKPRRRRFKFTLRCHWRASLMGFLVLAMSSQAFYAALYSPIFKIKQLEFLGQSQALSIVKPVFEARLAGQWLNFVPMNSTWFFNEAEVNKIATSLSTRILKANVSYRSLDETLEITLKDRVEFGIWCQGEPRECYYFDKSGLAFAAAPGGTGGILPSFVSTSIVHLKLGESVASTGNLEFLLSLRTALTENNFNILEFYFDTWQVAVKLEPGYEALFALDDSPAAQVRRLLEVINRELGPDVSRLKNIDLRAGNKVFYSFKEVLQ